MNKVLYQFKFKYLKFLLNIVLDVLVFIYSIYRITTPLTEYEETIFYYNLSKNTVLIPFVLSILFFIGTICYVIEYGSLKTKIRKKDFLVVEGNVKNFHSNKFVNVNTFEIDDVKFKINDSLLLNGFTKIENLGGVITENGQNLKIHYIPKRTRNIIVYIEGLYLKVKKENSNNH